MNREYDFAGYATKNDLRCSDGRTIRRGAFKDNDGKVVPLIWMHQHGQVDDCLGHALLENRNDGVYAYCFCNDTENGRCAKELVRHGDITALSIYANNLKQSGGDVVHGQIREVSLVYAGANPGALIDNIVAHGEESQEEAWIYNDDENICIHGEEPFMEEKNDQESASDHVAHSDDKEDNKMGDNGNRTVEDVIDSMNEEQKKVLYALVGKAVQEAAGDDEEDEGDDNMQHNLFDDNNKGGNVLEHSEMVAILEDGKRYGSLKDSFLAHGITNIENLFPTEKTIAATPDLRKREMSWVSKVMNSVHHTPFSRVKSMYVDITADAARAKGYAKGKKKVEEVVVALKRATTPTTVYKKQKLDRDDVVDITDFDVVAFLKSEMRIMLDEELARAYLIGDGRLASSDDKINEQNIRPIWTDDDVYTIRVGIDKETFTTPEAVAKEFIRSAIKARIDYEGSGNTVLYTSEDFLTDCLLLEDKTGRVIYDSIEKLATAMRVSSIVTVPVMRGAKRKDSHDSKDHYLMGIIVDLNDYNVGADKGGSVNMFDDFDINYNAMLYLIETRCSGALVKPKSAIAIELVAAASDAS